MTPVESLRLMRRAFYDFMRAQKDRADDLDTKRQRYIFTRDDYLKTIKKEERIENGPYDCR